MRIHMLKGALFALFLIFLFWAIQVTFGAPLSMSAFSKQGNPWPKNALTYYVDDSLAQKDALYLAVNQWNMTKAGPSLSRTRSKDRADFVVTGERTDALQKRCKGAPNGCVANATFGYRRFQGQAHLVMDNYESTIEGVERVIVLDPYDIATLAHEIGHLYGLEHNEKDQCSVMQPNGVSDTCPAASQEVNGKLFCGPSKVDIQAVAKLYNTKPVIIDPYCMKASS